jgi:N-acetylmuramoyl-L-alanine amidase
MKRLLVIVVVLILSGYLYAQNSIPVQFSNNSSGNTQIGGFVKKGIQYGSVDDLASIFRLQKYVNPETKKLELKSNLYTIKIASDNPFVIIVDSKENASMVQLPVNVLFIANSYFIPLQAFIPTLRMMLGTDVSFDGTKIVVGHSVPASKFDVTGLSFEEKSNGFLVRIKCTKEIPDFENWLKTIGTDTWLYITLAGVKADVEAIKRVSPMGLVKQILVFQSPTAAQLTLRLRGKVSNTEVIPETGSHDILVAIHLPVEEPANDRKPSESDRALTQERNRWKLDVVVIDAGHGGDDPGAIGITKTREKDITLAIGLQLGKLIEKSLPQVKVVYTRKTDEFIELYRRGQIANQNNGKLFISIHCNSMPHKKQSENGFEIYLLRPGKTENALRIAERENAVIKYEQDFEKRYQKLTDENFILLTMAQSAYVKYSEQFAGILQTEMGRSLPIGDNGVKQAGFYVLVGASMPNVLVETGYLSNKHDEKILKSVSGQRRIAESIFNGIRQYKQAYEQSLKEGINKDIGQK